MVTTVGLNLFNMKKKIIILGATGGCFDVLNLINDINKTYKSKKFLVVGFLEDNLKKSLNGIKILGKFKDAKKYENNHYFVTAIGSAKNFKKNKSILEKLNIKKKKFISLIHPTANISRYCKIGYGCLIFQNVTVSSNVKIEDFVQILPNTVINHDTLVEKYCKINTNCNVSGGVILKKMCYLGAGVIIRENVFINEKNLIGMGSVVLKSINAKNSTILGYPAKIRTK